MHDIYYFTPDMIHQRLYRQALGQFATGVTVVTCMTSTGPRGITVNSFTSVSLDPPLVLWCLDKESSRYNDFINARYYAIHILSDQDLNICNTFIKSDNNLRRFNYSISRNQVPLLDSCLSRFECTVDNIYKKSGDHDIIIGLVTQVTLNRGFPLLFYQGCLMPYNKPYNNL